MFQIKQLASASLDSATTCRARTVGLCKFPSLKNTTRHNNKNSLFKDDIVVDVFSERKSPSSETKLNFIHFRIPPLAQTIIEYASFNVI